MYSAVICGNQHLVVFLGEAILDQFVIGLSALASLIQTNSYSETVRLARYPVYAVYLLPILGALAQVFYGLVVIGTLLRPVNPKRGQSIALVFRHYDRQERTFTQCTENNAHPHSIVRIAW